MSVHPVRLRRIHAFISIAGGDLKGAKLLAAEARAQAMFLAQQSVEKLLRAVIEADDKRAGTTHNIAELAALLSSKHELYDRFLEFDDLSGASTRYRYPTSAGHEIHPPTQASFANTLQEIDSLTKQVVEFLEQQQLYRQD